MITKGMTAMLVLRDATMKPKVISLGVDKAEDLLSVMFSAYNDKTANYSYEVDLGKDVIYHDLAGTGKVRIYGQVGNFRNINAMYDQGNVTTKHTVEVYPSEGQAFKPLNSFLDNLQAWDTIQTFNPYGGSLNTTTIRSVGKTGVHTDNPNGTDKTSLARIIARRPDPKGYPKGTDYPHNYLGVTKPVMTPPYRMGRVSYKNYMCQCCGYIQSISTNHEGSCWAYCNACSWKPSAYGEGFILNRNRPFITAQLANIILEKGVEEGLVYYEYLTTENEREAT